MTKSASQRTRSTASQASPRASRDPGAARRNLIVVGVAVVLLGGMFLAATQILPHSWAESVGRQAAGSVTSAIGWGVFYGFIFTFFPVVVVALAFYRRWSIAVRIIIVVVGVLLAAPNLLTLGIVFGPGQRARTAEALLDKQADGFAIASFIAAVVAAVGGVTLWILAATHRRAVNRLAALRAERGITEPPKTSTRPAGESGTVRTSAAPSRTPRPATPQSRPSSQVRPATPSDRSSTQPGGAHPSGRSAEQQARAERQADTAGVYARKAARGVHQGRAVAGAAGRLLRKKMQGQQRDD